MSATKTLENPLVPNLKLRQMYEKMVELRILGDLFAGLRDNQSGQIVDSIRNEEACRVATAIDLTPGDLVSDAQPSPAMNHLAGLAAASLLAQVSDPRRRISKNVPAATRSSPPGRLMPWLPSASNRLRLALGAAVALKRAGQQKIVLVYAYPADLRKAEWRQVLEIAGSLELPIVFVLLPTAASVKPFHLNSEGLRVPRIPVDASDAVALYRVMQESLNRVRNDGGPVLINCRAIAIARGSTSIADPVAEIEHLLLDRKLATRSRLDTVGVSLRKKISSSKAPARSSNKARSR